MISTGHPINYSGASLESDFNPDPQVNVRIHVHRSKVAVLPTDRVIVPVGAYGITVLIRTTFGKVPPGALGYGQTALNRTLCERVLYLHQALCSRG